MNTVKTVGSSTIQQQAFIGKAPQNAFDFQHMLNEYNETMKQPEQTVTSDSLIQSDESVSTDQSDQSEQLESQAQLTQLDQTIVEEVLMTDSVKNEDDNRKQAEQEAIDVPSSSISPPIEWFNPAQTVMAQPPVTDETPKSSTDLSKLSMELAIKGEDLSLEATVKQGALTDQKTEATPTNSRLGGQSPTQTDRHSVVNSEAKLAQNRVGEGHINQRIVQETATKQQDVKRTGPKPTNDSSHVETAITITQQSAMSLESSVPVATVTIAPQMLATKGQQAAIEVSPTVIEKLSQPIVEKVTTMNTFDSQNITIELLPEKLGKIQISMKVTEQQVQLEFVVENSQTKQLLESITTKLERVLQKHEFPTLMQEKVAPTTAVPTPVQGESTFFDQSTFQQGFHQEQSKQQRFSKGTNHKSFTEMALEKIEATPIDGSVDLLV